VTADALGIQLFAARADARTGHPLDVRKRRRSVHDRLQDGGTSHAAAVANHVIWRAQDSSRLVNAK